MAGVKRKQKTSPTPEPATKRAARPRVARKQDDPVWSTTNPGSHLAKNNLHAIFCDPATYENWTKEDWDEVRDCFPDDVPLKEDGFSVDTHYLKYDSDWRRFIREYQEDLGAGRYETTWLKDAAEAMEARANGAFDAYKENEYEEFWGQKQVLHRDFLAGEAVKIQLSELVLQGIIKVGDELHFRRAHNREGQSWVIEKEMKILDIHGAVLVLAVPPGRRRYAALKEPYDRSKHSPIQVKAVVASKPGQGPQAVNGTAEANPHARGWATRRANMAAAGMAPVTKPKPKPKGSKPDPGGWATRRANMAAAKLAAEAETAAKELRPAEDQPKDPTKLGEIAANTKDVSESTEHTKIPDLAAAKITIDETTTLTAPMESDTDAKVHSETTMERAPSSDSSIPSDVVSMATLDSPLKGEKAAKADSLSPVTSVLKDANQGDHTDETDEYAVILSCTSLNTLEAQLTDMDGHINSKDVPAMSAWRVIRVKRNNQDLGSLFEMRDEYYVWKDDKIVKEPRRRTRK